MKYILFVVCGLVLFSCKEEKKISASDNADLINSTMSAKEVLVELQNLSGSEADQVKLFSEAIKENFNADLDEKAVYIFCNVLYNFDDENSIMQYAPIFLHLAQGRSAIANFYAGIKSAYVTKYPQSEYSKKVTESKTIATLLTNKAELINNNNFNRFSVEDAKDYIELSETYALVSPRDKDAGSQLIKAGNTAKNIKGYGAKAVELYDWFLAKQPDHPKAGQALFLKAFTYDNELKEPVTAEKLYKEFIEKYPDDDFVDDAELLLKNIGKTDQEFYESIVKQKNKE